MGDETFRSGLTRIRRRRWILWGTLLGYLPAIWLSLRITRSDAATGVVFGVWFAVLLVASCTASFAACPRCGNYFHVHGFVPLFTRRCLHCGLHVCADKREKSAPPPS